MEIGIKKVTIQMPKLPKQFSELLPASDEFTFSIASFVHLGSPLHKIEVTSHEAFWVVSRESGRYGKEIAQCETSVIAE
jgi:hypothetical protein